MKKIKLRSGKTVTVDDDDYASLNRFNWCEQRSLRTSYAVRNCCCPLLCNKSSKIYMHRCILKPFEGMETHHIDGNGLNNSKKNLKMVTHQENVTGRRVSLNATSKFNGVSYDQERNKWRASLTRNGKYTFFGRYSTEIEADAAVKDFIRC